MKVVALKNMDDAILGIDAVSDRLIYSVELLQDILVRDHDMTVSDAVDHISHSLIVPPDEMEEEELEFYPIFSFPFNTSDEKQPIKEREIELRNYSMKDIKEAFAKVFSEYESNEETQILYSSVALDAYKIIHRNYVNSIKRKVTDLLKENPNNTDLSLDLINLINKLD